MRSWKRNRLSALLAAGLALSMPACGGGGGGGDTGGDGNGTTENSIVGTWSMSYDDGGGTVFWVFDADGSWDQFDDPGLQDRHLGGTYTQTADAIAGPCSNPGVGDCDIAGTIAADGQAFQVDFIEHWHSPSKHVGLTGTRIQ